MARRMTLGSACCLLCIQLAVKSSCMAEQLGNHAAVPELPRLHVDTSMPTQAGRIIQVPPGGDFQAAVNRANPGDTIVLQAGFVYQGTFVMPKKEGTGWIVVKSSAEDSLPRPGTRITPAYAKSMARVSTTRNNQPAVRGAPGARHYRFVGVEFTAEPAVKTISAIVELSHNSTDLADVPSYIIFDRVYIHGRPDLDSQRGLLVNSRYTAVVDSWIDECHFHGVDSQAIASWNGPGPFKIENTFLEGGSENIMFGGAKNTAECMVPSDIEIRGNHLYKNPTWARLKYPDNWAVKNLFEIKTARRVLLEGNVFENCWAEGQVGYAMVIKSSSPEQGRAWDTTCDITIRLNRIVNSLNGIGIGRWSSSGPVVPGAPPTSRILIEHNVFERFGMHSDFANTGRGGIMFQLGGADVIIRHNTAWCDYNMLSLPNGGVDNLAFVDNLVTAGTHSVKADGRGVGWNPAIGTHILGASTMSGNAIIREGDERARKTDPDAFPSGNLWFDSFAAAGVELDRYCLSADSHAKRSATDGTNPGADTEAIAAATAGVRATNP